MGHRLAALTAVRAVTIPAIQFAGWYHDADSAAAGAVLDALARLGADVRRQTTSDPPPAEQDEVRVLAFLSSATAAEVSSGVAALDPAWRRRLIPIVFGVVADDRIDQTIRDVVRLTISKSTTPADVAERIVHLTEVSGAWLVEWNVLFRRASRGGSLLSQAELDKAVKLSLARPMRLVPSVPDSINRLITDSRRRLRRRRALLLSVALAVILGILAAGAQALIQRGDANSEAARARAAAIRSESDRLTRLSEAYLSRDPDLPILLARRAYSVSPNPESWQALRRSIDAVPAHRSYRLGYAASSLVATTRSAYAAVTEPGGTVALLDTSTGRTLQSVRAPEADGGPVLGLSADGTRLAIAYNNGIVRVRAMRPGFRQLAALRIAPARRSPSLSVAWVGDGRLLTAWQGLPAYATTIAPGRSTPITTRADGSPVALTVALHLGLAAFVTNRAVVVRRLAGWQPCGEIPERTPGTPATTIVFDSGGDYLVTARAGQSGLELAIPHSCGAPTHLLAPPSTGGPWNTDGGTVTALPSGGGAFGSATGTVTILRPPAQYAVQFLADSIEVDGIAVTAGDHLVTAGIDGVLRVWAPVAPPDYPTGPAQDVALTGAFGATQAKGSWRPLISISPNGSNLDVGGSNSGEISTVPVRTPGSPTDARFLVLDASIRPLPSGCGGLLMEPSGLVVLFDCEGDKFHLVWRIPTPVKDAEMADTAVSADNAHIAVAGPFGLTDYSTNGRPAVSLPVTDSEMVEFAGDELVDIGAEGELHTVTANGVQHAGYLSLDGDSVRAAGVSPNGRTAVVVTGSGRTLIVDLQTGRPIADIAIDNPLTSIIAVRFSADGRLAAVIAQTGVWVIEVAQRRIVFSTEGYTSLYQGADPSDAVFAPNDRTLYVLSAEEGITTFTLPTWGKLEGAPLLAATVGLIPRAFSPSQLRNIAELPLEPISS
ncbi:MAG: WD40 repeat domain-containing protein [Solirubrobacteraceae bacterium]